MMEQKKFISLTRSFIPRSCPLVTLESKDGQRRLAVYTLTPVYERASLLFDIQVDVFSFDLILLPIHLGMHWCLATIDFNNKQIGYYDSLKGNNQKCLTTLR